MFYVNVYKVNHAYGGPEEGGWWYEVGIPVHCEGPFDNHAVAVKWLEEQRKVDTKEEFPDEYAMGAHSRDGLDPDGNGDDRYLTPGGVWGRPELITRIEKRPAEPFPRERPHYE